MTRITKKLTDDKVDKNVMDKNFFNTAKSDVSVYRFQATVWQRYKDLYWNVTFYCIKEVINHKLCLLCLHHVHELTGPLQCLYDESKPCRIIIVYNLRNVVEIQGIPLYPMHVVRVITLNDLTDCVSFYPDGKGHCSCFPSLVCLSRLRYFQAGRMELEYRGLQH